MARGFRSLVFLFWAVQAFLTDTVESWHLSWGTTEEPDWYAWWYDMHTTPPPGFLETTMEPAATEAPWYDMHTTPAGPPLETTMEPAATEAPWYDMHTTQPPIETTMELAATEAPWDDVHNSQSTTQHTTESIPETVYPPGMTQSPLTPSLDCTDSGMTVFIPRSMIGEALASHLHFLDSACVGSHHNATHVKIATTYDRCGTLMEVREKNVMFSNIIHDEAVPVPGSVITRDQDIKIPVQCIMDSEGSAELSFRPDISKITFREDGYGTFNFSLRLYNSNNYARPYQSVDYPVHVGMGNKLYFEARTWSEPGLQLFVQTCRATPTTNPDDFHGYTFIQDGCIRDNTVAFHPSLDPDIKRFDIDAFAFVGSLPKPVVYVHCDMLLCNSSDAGSRCAIGCRNGASGSSLSLRRRHARSASGSRSYAITQGPISVEQDEGKEATFKMASVQLPVLLTTVCLLVGCVLVLGALVAVMRKRTKRLHKVMYEPVSTEDQEED